MLPLTTPTLASIDEWYKDERDNLHREDALTHNPQLFRDLEAERHRRIEDLARSTREHALGCVLPMEQWKWPQIERQRMTILRGIDEERRSRIRNAVMSTIA